MLIGIAFNDKLSHPITIKQFSQSCSSTYNHLPIAIRNSENFYSELLHPKKTSLKIGIKRNKRKLKITLETDKKPLKCECLLDRIDGQMIVQMETILIYKHYCSFFCMFTSFSILNLREIVQKKIGTKQGTKMYCTQFLAFQTRCQTRN